MLDTNQASVSARHNTHHTWVGISFITNLVNTIFYKWINKFCYKSIQVVHGARHEGEGTPIKVSAEMMPDNEVKCGTIKTNAVRMTSPLRTAEKYGPLWYVNLKCVKNRHHWLKCDILTLMLPSSSICSRPSPKISVRCAPVFHPLAASWPTVARWLHPWCSARALLQQGKAVQCRQTVNYTCTDSVHFTWL